MENRKLWRAASIEKETVIHKVPITILLIFIFCLYGFAASFSFEQIPLIKKMHEEYVVALPESMKKVLQSYDPEFVPFCQRDFLPTIINIYSFSAHQVPFAVVGDFNGDKIIDVVFQGHNKSNDLLVCILSQGEKFDVIEIEKFPLRDPKQEWIGMADHKEYARWIYLIYIPPGRISSGYEQKALDLVNDAFELIYFEKAAVLYYFKDGKFLKYVTAD